MPSYRKDGGFHFAEIFGEVPRKVKKQRTAGQSRLAVLRVFTEWLPVR